MRLEGRFQVLLLISAASVALGLPLLVWGFPLGHDSACHLIYQKHFGTQFWAGELYPRWLEGANGGLGSPMFFIYGPAPYWAGSLARPLVNALGIPGGESAEAALSALAALLAAGLAAYRWLREAAGRAAAAAGAVIYMVMPYHLVTDLYVRSALAEHWAFVWMPLVLYFARRAAKGEGAAAAGLGCAYALLIMSHVFSALLFSGFAALYAWWWLPERGRGPGGARLALGGLLGLGLSAVYLAPLAAHAKYMDVERLNRLPRWDYSNNFLRLSLTGEDGITLVTMLTLAVAGWGFVRARSSLNADQNRERRFWLAAGLMSVALMLPLSKPVWAALPALQAVQFPWRFNLVLVVSATALATLGLGKVLAGTARPRKVVLAVLPWVLAMSVAGLAKTSELRQRNGPLVRSLVSVGYEGCQMLLWARGAEWNACGTEEAAKLKATGEPVQHEGGGRLWVLNWSPREIRLGVRAEREGAVVVRRFYYPGWVARVHGRAGALRVEPAEPMGLMRVWAPAGAYEMTVRLDQGPWERFGGAVSGLCLAALAAGGVVRRLRSRR